MRLSRINASAVANAAVRVGETASAPKADGSRAPVAVQTGGESATFGLGIRPPRPRYVRFRKPSSSHYLVSSSADETCRVSAQITQMLSEMIRIAQNG